MARPISGTPCPMLTTAACPEASRNRRPSAAIIQQPSPREAIGKDFLKFRGNSPLRVGMRCPQMDCSKSREPGYWIRNRNVTISVVLRAVLLLKVFHRRGKMKGVILRCGLVGVSLLGFTLAVSAQETVKHPITFDDMIKLHRIAGSQVSPDGKWVAYTVATPDMEANRNASNIWMVPTNGGEALQLTQSGHDSSPVWAPDGNTLAFLSSRGGDSQVDLLSMDGGKAKDLTKVSNGAAHHE